MRTVAALLAAGGGTRFRGGTHKLLADLAGRPVHRHALDHLLAAGFDHVFLITGAAELDLTGLDEPALTVVHNPLWAAGQASSVRHAVDAASDTDAEAIVIGLADQPFVPAESWRRIADADPDAPLVIATYGGRRGPNPVRIHRALWDELPASGDEGARTLMRMYPNDIHAIPCTGSADDIDTLEDLQRWTSS